MTEPTPRLFVTRYDEVHETLAANAIIAVLSIEHPGAEAGARGAAPRLDAPTQLILAFWDVEQASAQGPDIAQVQAGLDFILQHAAQGGVLIHCHAGKSRSTAMALGALALLNPDMSAEELLEKLLAIRPVAAPNILMVEMIDQITGRGGTLLAAVLAHPQIDRQRRETEEARQSFMRSNPETARKIFPEKFGP